MRARAHRQASRGERLRVLGSDKLLASPTYPAVLFSTVLLVTLVWTVAVDWSTSDGLGTLLLAISLVILGALLVAVAVLGRERLRSLYRACCPAPRAKPIGQAEYAP